MLAAAELAAGAVVVVGSAVLVAVAIDEALAAYEREASREHSRPKTQPRLPSAPEPTANRKPEPEGQPPGRDWLPPRPPGPPPEPPRRPSDCVPRRVPPKGGHPLHNRCAENVPFNDFRGADALVNGKAFDALQLSTRTLWEIKTNAIETYNRFVYFTELDKQVEEAQQERTLAAACGFDFVIGVRTEAHKDALRTRDSTLNVVVMDWC
jgi:hypothetical protein